MFPDLIWKSFALRSSFSQIQASLSSSSGSLEQQDPLVQLSRQIESGHTMDILGLRGRVWFSLALLQQRAVVSQRHLVEQRRVQQRVVCELRDVVREPSCAFA